MKQNRSGASDAHRYFVALCRDAGHDKAAILELWADFASRRQLTPNIGRNFVRFLNSGGSVGPTFRAELLEFCETINLDVDEKKFNNRTYLREDFVGAFRDANSANCGLLELAVGEYHLFRPRVMGGALRLHDDDFKEMPLKIAQLSNGSFTFEYRNGVDYQYTNWSGHALCSGRYIYLIGFEASLYNDCMMMILTNQGKYGNDTDVLVGTQLMRADWMDRDDNKHHEKIVGRLVAVVRSGIGEEDRAKKARVWLEDRASRSSHGFVVETRSTVLGRSGA